MSARLDPWRDASRIAARLAQAHTLLVLVVGAEQWCWRCRALRPVFDQLAALASEHEVWLWLDLEEHTEFIGDFYPDNLPVLLTYRGEQLTSLQPMIESCPAIDLLVASARHATTPCTVPEPGIRERLLLENWAPRANRTL